MLDEQLHQELTRVAAALPVPGDLFPGRERLAAARRGRHRSLWMTAAAVAAALIFSLTPMGQQVVRAAADWVTHYRVEVVAHDTAPSWKPALDYGDLKIGDSRERGGTAGLPREVYRAMTLADLLKAEPAWPVPAYLGPGPDTKVVRSEIYGPDGTVMGTGIELQWRVKVGGHEQIMAMNLARTHLNQAVLDDIASGKQPGVVVYGTPPDAVRQQEVTVKGQTMTASYLTPTWGLTWWHSGGMGHIDGVVPLDELVKIVDSMPSLQ